MFTGGFSFRGKHGANIIVFLFYRAISTNTLYNLEFDYDAFGGSIAKHVLTQGNVLVKYTYYILDAQGNQLSTYEHVLENEESKYELAERVIYCSSQQFEFINNEHMRNVNS